MSQPVTIRPATPQDRDAIWRVLEPVIRTGETYPLPRDWDKAQALRYWLSSAHEVFVADDAGQVAGTYYLRANNQGGGAHVANCGYMVAGNAQGRGIARAMCEHSLIHAKARGFRAMQFNFVIASNERAVRLWQSCGFEILARLPGVFEHPRLGGVDAYVMHRFL
jgi:ribosomal protein S18 acetylase RimI-like enzyme